MVSRRHAGMAAAIAVAIAAGVWTGRIAAPADDGTPATRTVHAGTARLAVPAAWQPAGRAGRTTVLDPSLGLNARVLATLGPADDPSLIPRSLRTLLRDPSPRPQASSLGGRPAWTYPALATRRPPLMMDITVVPTTAGVLAVACAAPAATRAASGCASEVEWVSVRGAATLQPSPAVPLAARLPAVLARLDRARVEDRAALERAGTPAAQAALAHRLAGRHQAAERALRPPAGAPWTALVEDFRSSGLAYAALGRAAADGSAARFGAARRAIRTAESRLASAIDGALTSGSVRTVTSAPAALAAGAARPQPGEPIVVVVLVLLASGAAGFLMGGPAATAAGALARAARPRPSTDR